MTQSLGRRELIGRGVSLGAGASAAALPSPTEAWETGGPFTFLHYTDVHVEPERRAAQGFSQAVDAMKREAPGAAFALCGGDLVFDANAVPFARASHLYDLCEAQSRRLGLPIHHCLGNHDLFALGPDAPVGDPHAGRALFRERTGLAQTDDNVKAVLQGHTHVVEEIASLGTRYLSAGSVCGDWWKGRRLGVHPEGFTVCTAHESGGFEWRYVPYGWAADQAA